MWVRVETGELINLDHSHHIHMFEHGAPKFNIEVIASIGHERYVIAHIPTIGAAGRQVATEFMNQLVLALDREKKIVHVPMYPRTGHGH